MEFKSKKVAVIDIGSNAMRSSIVELKSNGTVSIIKNYRWPIRLGFDVFKSKKILDRGLIALEEAFGELFLKLSKHNVQNVYAVATSAFRDASNKSQIINTILKQTGILIRVIDGPTEAKLIKRAVVHKIDTSNTVNLLVDIGGGSTELTYVKNSKTIFSKSYQIGTVRLLAIKSQKTRDNVVKNFILQSQKEILKIRPRIKIDRLIGTGGNLRSMGKIRKQVLNQNSSQEIYSHELKEILAKTSKLTIAQRMEIFNIRKDRADVIDSAMLLILQLCNQFDVLKVLLPRVGLKEGVLLHHLNSYPKEIKIKTN